MGVSTPASGSEMVQPIQVNRIDSNPRQPRRAFRDLEALADSLRRQGLLEPIMVRPVGDRYQIIHGERRWRAAQLAGFREVVLASVL